MTKSKMVGAGSLLLPTSTQAARRARPAPSLMLMWVVLFSCGLTVGGHRVAESAPPQWSMQRLSVVVTAQGAVFDKDGQQPLSSFLPQLGLSYSATSAMSLVAIAERDFARKLTIGRLGGRFRIAKIGEGVLGVGLDGVFYADEGRTLLHLAKETSWDASVHLEVPVSHYKTGATALFLTTSAGFDVNNSLRSYRAGLRLQAVGGKP